ncbi:GNAT family N-acetyltransferase [Amnibacterium flavum]|uniref:GNAT family N-acetyltransferase n=1 Tax=Amnibacterium flavum TaxID=2173173 RepID=A0A2V1HSP1_9MICO|nr:GNAT family N-acetyltransferase [Amnibacterium flavum]
MPGTTNRLPGGEKVPGISASGERVFSVRPAVASDAAGLAAVAALTFPLACPPTTTDAAKAEFIRVHLTEERFDSYLADPSRRLVIAEVDGEMVGYTMLVFAEPYDADVAAAVQLRPTAELSKCYVLPGHHGNGIARALIESSVDIARRNGAVSVWLGVNHLNARANRFYEKNGFERVGTKKFLVGDVWEDDFVREIRL